MIIKETQTQPKMDIDQRIQQHKEQFIELLSQSPSTVFWRLCYNPSAIDLVEETLTNNPDGIDPEQEIIIWHALSFNPAAVHLVEQEINNNLDGRNRKISWACLCANTAAIHLIEEEFKRSPNWICWGSLCRNPAAIHLIEEELANNPNSDKMCWRSLCENPAAIHLIEKELTNIPNNRKLEWEYLFWESLSLNLAPEAAYIIEEVLEKIETTRNRLASRNTIFSISNLCMNPSAIHLIEAELKNKPENIVWTQLCENPAAIHLIEEELTNNPDSTNISWVSLSRNPAAIHLLKQHPDKISWSHFIASNYYDDKYVWYCKNILNPPYATPLLK